MLFRISNYFWTIGLFSWLHEMYIFEFIFSLSFNLAKFLLFHLTYVCTMCIRIHYHYYLSLYLFYPTLTFLEAPYKLCILSRYASPPFYPFSFVNRYVLCVKYPHAWLCFELLWLASDLLNRIECIFYVIYFIVWTNFDVLWYRLSYGLGTHTTISLWLCFEFLFGILVIIEF